MYCKLWNDTVNIQSFSLQHAFFIALFVAGIVERAVSDHSFLLLACTWLHSEIGKGPGNSQQFPLRVHAGSIMIMKSY